jgi:hypothetical protein
MNRRTTLTLTTMALLCLSIGLLPGSAVAQQNERVFYKVPAANAKITQQQNIDVGDVPNHIMRVFEVHRTFPNDAPVFNGLKLVDQWDRGIVDQIAGNGSNSEYHIFVMENGDRFFARGTNVLQRTSDNVVITGVGFITGGTGKFAAMQGTLRASTNIDLKTGANENQTDIEYSVGK